MFLIDLIIEMESSLTVHDYLGLIALYKKSNEKLLDLSRYSPEQIAAFNKQKGLIQNKALNVTVKMSWHDLAEQCPVFMDDFILQSWMLFDKGIMPYQGSLSEQPNKIIECFNVLSALKNEQIEQETKKREKINNGK